MRPVHTVSYISYRKVEWIVFILSGGDGHGGLVTPENDWNEGCSLRGRPQAFGDAVLIARCKCTSVKTDTEEISYRLTPCPVATHEMLEPTMTKIPMCVVSIGTKVYFTREFGIGDHAEDDLASIPVVNFILLFHPRRRVVSKVALVADGEALPADAAL